MSNAIVSVIIPTYNRASLLPRAIESVLAQTFGDWEIVLVDDGSTDGTAELAARYAATLGDRFVHIRQANRGSSAARNTGIDACGGRFVAFLDSDDEFLPNKLERQLALFALRPELGFVYSDFAYVGPDGVRHDSVFDAKCPLARSVPSQLVAPGLRVCTGNLFDFLLRGYFIATIVGMVRRDVLGGAIRFAPHLAYAEEWLFYLKVARACLAGFVDEPLCLHHLTPGSLARTDPHRNTSRYRDTLQAIHEVFVDLSPVQRQAVRENLAKACRQLGYDACRAGQYCRAAGQFVRSFRYQPNVHALCNALEAGVRLLFAGSTQPQDEKTDPVRAQA